MANAISSENKPTAPMMLLTKLSSRNRLSFAGSGADPFGPPKLIPLVKAELKTFSPIPSAAIPRAPMMKKTSRIRRRDSSTSV
jgi:hypothetical protein